MAFARAKRAEYGARMYANDPTRRLIPVALQVASYGAQVHVSVGMLAVFEAGLAHFSSRWRRSSSGPDAIGPTAPVQVCICRIRPLNWPTAIATGRSSHQKMQNPAGLAARKVRLTVPTTTLRHVDF